MDLAAEARSADDAVTPEAQADYIWENLPAEQHSAARANIDVYLGDFISVVQGGPRERRQMLRHLFQKIDWVFCSNKESDTNRKDPISLKNMGQGDGSWSTQKTFLRWDLDTIYNLLRLTPR